LKSLQSFWQTCIYITNNTSSLVIIRTIIYPHSQSFHSNSMVILVLVLGDGAMWNWDVLPTFRRYMVPSSSASKEAASSSETLSTQHTFTDRRHPKPGLICLLTEQLAQAVTLVVTRILEEPGFNFDQDTGFPWPFQANSGTVPQIWPRLLPSKYFTVYYSLISLPFDPVTYILSY
jgi:hypothetical protein